MVRILSHETTLRGEGKRLGREAALLEKISGWELLLGIVLALAGIVYRGYSGSYSLLGLGIFIAFLGAAHRSKRKEDISDKERFEKGSWGERQVLKQIERRLGDEYVLFNDIDIENSSKSTQIDHLVIGPSGIFVIETKNYSGTLTGKATDRKLKQERTTKEGKRIVRYLSNPVSQNDYHCRMLREFLNSRGLALGMPIFSCVVFTNKWVEVQIQGSEVPILTPGKLPGYILNQPGSGLPPEEIEKIALTLCGDSK